MNREKVLHLLEKALSYQFDSVYSWNNMIDDIEDLTDEEKMWAKEHTTYQVKCDEKT
ncbi:unnamed protein product [marine sediment metagenome]|uniref:Uncharacterized protein n=1 Tax=marine sediment metagenome TaxID=412755 RepID=X0TGS6_9ZZZZ